jgi:hypothetical protein
MPHPIRTLRENLNRSVKKGDRHSESLTTWPKETPSMNEMLLDLYGHQAWADAEHWRAIEAQPGALEDSAIRDRLYHYHLTQRAFLFVVRGDTLSFPKPEDFPEAIREDVSRGSSCLSDAGVRNRRREDGCDSLVQRPTDQHHGSSSANSSGHAQSIPPWSKCDSAARVGGHSSPHRSHRLVLERPARG